MSTVRRLAALPTTSGRPAVEPSKDLRTRAGYRHRGIVPRPAA
jgi:hypothetical protein